MHAGLCGGSGQVGFAGHAALALVSLLHRVPRVLMYCRTAAPPWPSLTGRAVCGARDVTGAAGRVQRTTSAAAAATATTTATTAGCCVSCWGEVQGVWGDGGGAAVEGAGVAASCWWWLGLVGESVGRWLGWLVGWLSTWSQLATIMIKKLYCIRLLYGFCSSHVLHYESRW